MKKISVYILICILCAMCAACTKGSSTLSNIGETVQSMPEPSTSDTEASKEQSTESEFQSETESEAPKETESETQPETVVGYELNTVESLEDDGKEMSAAEAFRSTMKGKHSALELFQKERLFDLGGDEDDSNAADGIKDMPDTGLARINMLTYNRSGIGGAITPSISKWERFTCVDLDGNGTKEVLVDNIGIMAVLHYLGDEVYMTNLCMKELPYAVYENGVCETAVGGFDRQFYRLYPAKGAIYREWLIYEYIVPEGMDTSHNVYKIKGKDVTEEELNAYLKELIGGLTPLEWHEFTEENIDKYVVD